MPPPLPSEFTAFYRLFLRATSAAVLHNRPALRSLRKTYRHSFEAAASAIKRIQAKSGSPEGVEDAKRWLAEFDTRITSTLELLHNSALSRGLPHRVVSRLALLARSNYGWSVGHYYMPATPWNPQLPPNSPEYKIRLPSEISRGGRKTAREKRTEDKQLNGAVWGPLGEVIQMAEGRDGLVLGRVGFKRGKNVFVRESAWEYKMTPTLATVAVARYSTRATLIYPIQSQNSGNKGTGLFPPHVVVPINEARIATRPPFIRTSDKIGLVINDLLPRHTREFREEIPWLWASSAVTLYFGGTLPQRPSTIPPLLRSAEEMSGVTNDAAQTSHQPVDEPVFFDVDFGNGAIQHVARSVSADYNENPAERKSSLLSDDEFEPIRMSIAKRIPKPSEMVKKRQDTSLSPDDAVLSIESSESDGSGISLSSSDPVIHPLSLAPTSASSSTLFSVSSSASASSTYVNHPKPGRRTFYKFDDCMPRTVPVIVTPDSVTGTRGLTNLRSHGYDFDWSRLAARTDAAHGLSPEDSAELEMFLSKGAGHLTLGSNSGPATPAKASPKKIGFEKKLRDVLKMGK